MGLQGIPSETDQTITTHLTEILASRLAAFRTLTHKRLVAAALSQRGIPHHAQRALSTGGVPDI